MRPLALAVATDLGSATDEVRAMLAGCRLLVVEANHDLDMLWGGPYPLDLKRRIASDDGHLSNDQVAELLAGVAGPELWRVVLAHLNAENNAPRVALATVAARLGDARLVIEAAPRTRPGPLIRFADGLLPEEPSAAQQLGLPWTGPD